MDLSDFDIHAGDPRERVSKAGTLPVLLPPVLWLDLALSPLPVPVPHLKQMLWGKTALCHHHCHTARSNLQFLCGAGTAGVPQEQAQV